MVTQDPFALTKCNKCGFVITNPHPVIAKIGKYYKSDTYISHTNKSNSIINKLYKIIRKITLRQKLNYIETYSKTGKLLDYGCGTGHFLQYAKEKGWTVSGIEPDTDARSIAQTNVDQHIYKDLEEFNTKNQTSSYDTIILFHVLEHVHQLNDVLSQLISLLKEKGTLIIALPNHLSFDAIHYKEFWAAYDVPRHLYHFTQNDLANLAQKHGLKLVATIPMKFDSYYVSMLSEKNKRGHTRYLRAFTNGYRSNRRAKKTKEYSSLLYVLSNNG